MPAESQLIQKQVSGHIYNFVRSPNVKIFPCAYRGYYTQDAGGNITTKVFDPEARGYTEYNYTNMYSKVQRNKQSYVIDWKVTTGDDGTGPSLLKCVIGGYYFEIKGLLLSDFQGANAPKRLAIRTREVTLSNEPDDCERKSKILSGFIETTNYLDIRHSEGVYIFVGLAVLDQNEDVSYSDDLVPFKYASSTDNSLVLD